MQQPRSWKKAFQFWRANVAGDVDAEMRFHLDARTADLISSGVAPAEARARAIEEFGDLDQVRAGLNDIDRRIAGKRRRTERVRAFVSDLRLAVRSLIRTPAFTVAAVLTMALGVGVNSVIFSAVNGVLLQPLGYHAPDELMDLRETRGAGSGTSSTRGSTNSVSPANLMDYRRETSSFTGLAAYDLVTMNLTGGSMPRRVFAARVTSNFFDVLGAAPARGRTLRAGEDLFGGPRLVVLGDEMWQQLGADSAIVGKTVQLDDQSYEVIGVLPAGFKSPNQDRAAEPIGVFVAPGFPPDLIGPQGHGDHEVDVVARLKPGVSIEQAQSDLLRVSASLEKQYPESNTDVRAIIHPLRDSIVANVRTALLVLLGAVGLVWLVACVNLANLMLVRAVSRQREISVRVALGASRARVLQALVAHGVVVAVAGCALGIVLGMTLKGLLLRFAPADIPRLDAIAFDIPVFAVTAALSLVAGVTFGVLPAWRASRADPAQSLRASSRNATGSSVLKWQRGLVVAEIALSCVLLVGSGLLLRSFASVMGVELGFRTDKVLAVGIPLPRTRYPDGDARLRFFEALEERLTAIPGVRAITYANRLPMRGGWSTGLQSDLMTDSTASEESDMQAVSPGYFDTFGIRLVRGRPLAAADRKGSQRVVVVNEVLARRFFPNGDAVGHRLRRGSYGEWMDIVGVVSDVRRGGKTSELLPQAYVAAGQTSLYPVLLADLAIRTDGDPYAIVNAVRDAVLAVDPNQPIASPRTMDDVVSRSVAMRRFEALLLALFAATALALAVVGIFGVVSYSVAQRTREFGLRVALGARSGQVLGEVLGQASVLVVAGLALGAAGSFWLSRYVESLLFQVTPTDPVTYLGVGVTLGAVALIACVVPARRAASVDPVRALRYE